MATTFTRDDAKKTKEKDYTSVVQSLKMAMVSKVVATTKPENGLKDLIGEVKPAAGKSVTAAKILLVLDQETSTTLSPEALDLLQADKKSENRAFAKIYSPRSTPEEVRAALDNFPTPTFVERAARYHAKVRINAPTPESELGATAEVAKLAVVGLVFVVILLLCPAAWIFFVLAKNTGSIKPKGVPMGEITMLQADALAMKGVHIVLLFVVGSPLLAKGFSYILPDSGTQALATMTAFVAILMLLLKHPVYGLNLSLDRIGYNKLNLGKNVLWGIGAFIAELPIGLLIALGSTQLFKSLLPSAEHGAVEVLQKSNSLGLIFATLVLGVLFAAFWEEILFRGILFPGISKVLGGHWVGALISSFMFAAIHPQGIILWAPLAWMAGISCLVSRYSGSLVPSFILHMLHNLTLMGITLLMR